MDDAIFVASKISGDLTIGDKHEIDKSEWRKPLGVRLTPTSRYWPAPGSVDTLLS